MRFQEILNPAFAENFSFLSQKLVNLLLNLSSYFLFGIPFFKHFSRSLKIFYSILGDTATFRCNAVYDSDLRLKIKWLKDRELIDFETEPRFVQSSDQSLTITKTTELDSGTYTCLAESELDKAEASATLIVQDVPNPPGLRWVRYF